MLHSCWTMSSSRHSVRETGGRVGDGGTAEPAHGGLVLSNKTPSCFPETAGQSCKPCGRSMRRRQSFELRLHLEPKSCPCTQDQKTGMELALELELQNLSKSKGSIVQECPLLMSLTIDGQAPRSSNHHLLCQCFCIPVPGEPLKPAPNPGSGSSSFAH